MNDIGKKRVLVAALDWGLGHATRTVPLIRNLQKDADVILASAGASAAFYRKSFPALNVVEKPAYGVRYFQKIPLSFSILIQLPFIALAIIREHFWLRKIIRKENITHVISDNCYGIWNRKIHSTFITHQLHVICPRPFKILEPLIERMIGFFVNRFDECLVPDYEGGNNLAGILSHPRRKKNNVKCIGPLSRFSDRQYLPGEKSYDIVVLISGPEPMRTGFEDKCENLFGNSGQSVCIIRGLPNRVQKKSGSNITWYNHLSDDELAPILLAARKIICRSGYSTIMDLHTLGLSALLIPTPGQSEQEYLAEYLSGKGFFETIDEDELEVSLTVKSSQNALVVT